MAPSRPGVRSVIAVAVAVLLLAAGCGDGAVVADPASTTSDRETGSASPDDGTSEAGSESGSETDAPSETETERRGFLAWLLSLGPSAPDGPAAFDSFESLLDPARCREVLEEAAKPEGERKLPGEPSGSVFVGAAAGCVATVDGDDALWAEAARLRDEVADQQDAFTCIDRAVFELLDGLLTQHAEFPDGIDIQTGSATQGIAPPCPRIERLEPERGPVGTEVTVHGQNLAQVWIGIHHDDDGQSRPPEVEPAILGQTDTTVTFAIPEGSPEQVCVVVITDPNDWAADGRLFTVDAAATTDTTDTTDTTTGEDPSPGPSVTAAGAIQTDLTCPPPPL